MREGIGLLVDIGHDSASRYLLDGLAVLMDELRLGSVAPKKVRGRPAAARRHLSPLPRGTARVDLAPAIEQLERVVSRNRAAAARGLAAKGDQSTPQRKRQRSLALWQNDREMNLAEPPRPRSNARRRAGVLTDLGIIPYPKSVGIACMRTPPSETHSRINPNCAVGG